MFGSYNLTYNKELNVYEYQRRALHSLLGLYERRRILFSLTTLIVILSRGERTEGPLLAVLHNNAHCAGGTGSLIQG